MVSIGDEQDDDGQRYLLTFTFAGEQLPVKELEKILNLKPEKINLKGDHPHGKEKYKPHSTNSWHSPTYKGYNPEDYYTEIESILRLFEKQEAYIIDLVDHKGVEITFYTTLTGGPCVTELLLPSFWKFFDKYKVHFRLDSCA